VACLLPGSAWLRQSNAAPFNLNGLRDPRRRRINGLPRRQRSSLTVPAVLPWSAGLLRWRRMAPMRAPSKWLPHLSKAGWSLSQS